MRKYHKQQIILDFTQIIYYDDLVVKYYETYGDYAEWMIEAAFDIADEYVMSFRGSTVEQCLEWVELILEYYTGEKGLPWESLNYD